NSTGRSLFALIPPTFAAARTTTPGFSAAKKRSTASAWRKSNAARSRRRRLMKPSCSSFRRSALPTSPRWPAIKILSDFSTGRERLWFSIFFFPAMRNPQFVRKNGARLGVQKTYKLLIGGKFVRSESGRVAAAAGDNGKRLANYSRASRKDFRDAVAAARAAFGGWSKQSAYLRSQILYRA